MLNQKKKTEQQNRRLSKTFYLDVWNSKVKKCAVTHCEANHFYSECEDGYFKKFVTHKFVTTLQSSYFFTTEYSVAHNFKKMKFQ